MVAETATLCCLGERVWVGGEPGRMSLLTLHGKGAGEWSHGVIGRGAKTALQGVARPCLCLQCAQEDRRSREKREKLGPESASRRPRREQLSSERQKQGDLSRCQR